LSIYLIISGSQFDREAFPGENSFRENLSYLFPNAIEKIVIMGGIVMK
jgi:hypothetical protein